MRGLAGKVALITGAASGIGLACARRLAAEGVRVLLTDVAHDGAAARASELRNENLEVQSMKLDVTDEACWSEAIRNVVAGWGRLDVLVNNAGIAVLARTVDLTYEQFRRQSDVN